MAGGGTGNEGYTFNIYDSTGSTLYGTVQSNTNSTSINTILNNSVCTNNGITALAYSVGGTPIQGNAEVYTGSIASLYDVTPISSHTDFKIVKAIRNGEEYDLGLNNVQPNIELLVVGGGGQGGGNCGGFGGGGGAGGVIQCNGYLIEKGQPYNVIIGAGGCGDGNRGCNGCDTCFGTLIAYGGGRGLGTPGGSGGGAIATNSGYATNKGGGCCIGQGNKGGGGLRSGYSGISNGGGGGAGEEGYSGGNVCNYGLCSGRGGDGIQSCISGENCWYAGGGGSGIGMNAGCCEIGCGGCGGGGNGGAISLAPSAATYYGGGGGGVSYCCSVSTGGGAGYQGIVIARYHTDGSDGINCATGGCVYCCDGYTIHCFTSDGTFCIVN